MEILWRKKKKEVPNNNNKKTQKKYQPDKPTYEPSLTPGCFQ